MKTSLQIGLCGMLLVGLSVASAGAEAWRISSQVNGGPAKAVPVVFIRPGDTVSLRCEAVKSGKSAPVADAISTSLQWQELKPVFRPYDNTRGTMAAVEYRRDRVATGTALDLEFGLEEVGTHYYTVSGRVMGERTPVPSSARFRTAEPLQRAFAGHVVQVVCRADASYLGYLKELMGTPFIMGPGVTSSGFHQTDQRVGSDCAAFATYGRRRQGFPVPYGGPSGILHYLREIIPGLLSPGPDGVYRTAHGETAAVGIGGIRPGDILHFGPQVSIFYEDRGVRGKLDAADLLLESWGEPPHITTLRNCGFYQCPVRAMRWR